MEPDQLVSMSAEDYPRIIPFPIFPAPGILCGRAPDDRISPKVLCGRCGSPMTYENPREFSIYACTLEDLTLVKPQAHIMVGEMLPWLNFGDGLPCYAKGFRSDLIGHGPSNLPPVSVESVRTNSENTNASRDNFSR